MSEEFEFLTENEEILMTKTPDIDPYKNKKTLDPLGFDLFKHNCIIFLDVILERTKECLDNDVLERIKCFFQVRKVILFRTEDKVNYKKIASGF